MLKGAAGGKDFRRVAKQLDEVRQTLPDSEGRNVLTVRQQFDAITRGDYAAVLEQASPAIEFEIFGPPEFPFVPRARGLAEVRSAIEQNFAALEHQQPVITNVLAQGNVLVLIGSEQGRVRQTSAAYDVEFVHRFTFSDVGLVNIRIIVARALGPRTETVP